MADDRWKTIDQLTPDASPLDTDRVVVQKVGEELLDPKTQTRATLLSGRAPNFSVTDVGGGTTVAAPITNIQFQEPQLQVTQPVAGAARVALGPHGSLQHTGNVLPGGANQDLGAAYLDIAQEAAPASPGAGVRRVFVDSGTGLLSVRTSAGATVSLEGGGGGGGGGGGVTLAPDGGTTAGQAVDASDHRVQPDNAGVASVRTLGTGAQQACAGNDSRLSDGRAPSGAAGGDLSGTYPNPSIGSHAVTAAQFRQSAARSVVGVSGASTADVADISASADGQVLKRTGGALAFGFLTASDGPAMVAAGGGHSAGLVPDPGASAHTPPYVLCDDAAWRAGSPNQGRYHPDRQPAASLLYTSSSDELVGGQTLSWTAFNSGEGLAMTPEYDTVRVSQTSGTASLIYRGYYLAVPPSGNWRFYAKFSNEVSNKSGNGGSGQAGIGLGIGGTAASPTSAEFFRVFSQQSIDHANNSSGDGYGAASGVRQSGTVPSNWGVTAQWIYLSFRYTASSRLVESFYSLNGYQWVALTSMTPASSAVPVSFIVWVAAGSTTILPSVRLAWIRTRTDVAGIAGAMGA